MRKYYTLVVSTLLCLTLFSCGSFGEGLLMGMSGMSGYGYGGGYSGFASPSPGTGNMDYLLDPNYAMAQTMAQQNQLNQVQNAIMTQTVNQVYAKEEQEYNEFCRYNKKPDGTNYTKSEWRALQGQALQNMKSGSNSTASGNSGGTSSGSYGTNSSSGSSSRTCLRLSVSDYAHCNGTGVCVKCNGKKKYYDTSFGNSHWVDPCVVCSGTGKCPGCHGTGRR